ncbi:hypothetical protein EYF80_066061 [Liparis tanakae]|uniref:Uncharacterized protein n=1 Tax=Liparis tanakae TaxID=230148 RepID=A0A4Z2E531_9TELE|nr:hypothetical protein EYF80_066061 [Liparis tanakae]
METWGGRLPPDRRTASGSCCSPQEHTESTACDVTESTACDVTESTACDVTESTACDVTESTACDVTESTACDVTESTACPEVELCCGREHLGVGVVIRTAGLGGARLQSLSQPVSSTIGIQLNSLQDFRQ